MLPNFLLANRSGNCGNISESLSRTSGGRATVFTRGGGFARSKSLRKWPAAQYGIG